MKQVVEKRNATNQETHLLFVDLAKAYDSIPILKLWEVKETYQKWGLDMNLNKTKYFCSTQQFEIRQRQLN